VVWPPQTFTRVLRSWLAPLLVFIVVGSVACKEDGGIEVSDFVLVGVHALSTGDILRVLATRRTGRLPWSPREYFDRSEFENDLHRIQAFYADHGYPHARVTAVDAVPNAQKTAVKLTVTVDEGPPVIVDEVRFQGFDQLSASNQKSLASVPLKAGAPRVYDEVKVTRDQATQLFLNTGHPQAFVDALERPGAMPDHVVITFRAQPGPAMTFGDVTVNGLESVTEDVVTRELAFKPGGIYRDSQVLRTQHRLSRLEVFQVASVTARVDAIKDNRVPVQVTVAEGPQRQVKLGLGYGSEERVRATVDWRHVNFLGGARQAEVEAKGSFLDRGVKVTLTQPYFIKPGLSLDVAGTAWHTDQLTYNSQTYGGRATLSYRRETNLGAGRSPVRYGFHLAFIHEYLRYGIDPTALADLSSREERIALGLDPTTGQGAGTLGAIDFDAERTVVDRQLDPHKGFSLAIHAEHAAPWLLGSYRFSEIVVDARGYVPVGSWVLAGRLRAGSVAAADPTLVPFSKLYFLGGSTSERGWGRFEISPLDVNGLPIGGRTLAESSFETRVPLSNKFTVVGFLDAGDVSAGNWAFGALTPRIDAGAGLRYSTQIGVVRIDYAHQLNRITGLVVNGAPETRFWRVHFSIGQAF
jgi:outer membrane protein assembly complex protein YaeT